MIMSKRKLYLLPISRAVCGRRIFGKTFREISPIDGFEIRISGVFKKFWAGIVVAPLALPFADWIYIRYQETRNFEPPKTEVGHRGVLPQHFGDMFGWEEMAAKTAEVYIRCRTEEARKSCDFRQNLAKPAQLIFSEKIRVAESN